MCHILRKYFAWFGVLGFLTYKPTAVNQKLLLFFFEGVHSDNQLCTETIKYILLENKTSRYINNSSKSLRAWE